MLENRSMVLLSVQFWQRIHLMLCFIFNLGVFEELIRENISELYDHLRELGILHMISLSWFLTLFLR